MQLDANMAGDGGGGGALDSAGRASLLTFSWLNQVFETGASRQLRAEDLPGLARIDRTAVWAERCVRIVLLLGAEFMVGLAIGWGFGRCAGKLADALL